MRIKLPKTPIEDQPKTNRAYPLQVRTGGPANPIYGMGAIGSVRGMDSHPVYGGTGFTPAKREDTSQDPREWIS